MATICILRPQGLRTSAWTRQSAVSPSSSLTELWITGPPHDLYEVPNPPAEIWHALGGLLSLQKLVLSGYGSPLDIIDALTPSEPISSPHSSSVRCPTLQHLWVSCGFGESIDTLLDSLRCCASQRHALLGHPLGEVKFAVDSHNDQYCSVAKINALLEYVLEVYFAEEFTRREVVLPSTRPEGVFRMLPNRF